MKSRVYFTKIDKYEDIPKVKAQFSRLLADSGILGFINPSEEIVIKMHFGEEGNTGFVKPEYVRCISDGILRSKANCFLSDTNTLYRGRRTNSMDHLKLAYEHGFTKETCGCEVVIPDDSKAENVKEVYVGGKFIAKAKVAKIFSDADVILGLAHFKGHIMTGFGGALKNIGMGCATREGKLVQHGDVSPLVVVEKCTGCQECLRNCPVNAIVMKNNKAHIIPDKCIGCATCIAVCPVTAIDVNWESGGSTIQQRMIEYAKAVLRDKLNNCAFINFAAKITKECDCLAKDDERIAPDTGILISTDPVSVDKASYDLIIKAAGKDVFKQAHPLRNGLTQLEYASSIGLGSLEYELISI